MYEQAKGQDRVMLLAFLHLAARKGELFRLKWEDIDFERTIVNLFTRKRQDGSLEADPVRMTTELKQELLKWKEDCPLESEFVFICLDEYNFTRHAYGKPFTQRYHFMKRLCARAGVKPFGFHSIRHLTASILDKKGVELTIIQSVLRHKSATTTARYLHSLRGAGEVLDQVMPSFEKRE